MATREDDILKRIEAEKARRAAALSPPKPTIPMNTSLKPAGLPEQVPSTPVVSEPRPPIAQPFPQQPVQTTEQPAQASQPTDLLGRIEAERQRRAEARQTMIPFTNVPVETGLRTTTEFMSGVNSGLLADFLGAPVDIVNFGLSFAGLGSEKPVGGSRFFQDLLKKTGVAPTPAGATLPERIGRGVGFAAGTAIPVLGVGARTAQGLRAAQAAGKTLTPGEQILTFAGTRPAAFLGSELTSAAGGELGAEVARNVEPDSPLAEFLGRVVGSFGTTAIPSVARTGARYAKKVITPALTDMTRRGQLNRAAAALRGATLDPARAVENLKARPPSFDGAIFTSAQLADDPGLLALERGVIRSNAQLGGHFREIEGQLNRAARNEISDALAQSKGNPRALKDFVTARINRVTGMIQERIDTAKTAMRRTLKDLSPILGKAEASNVARKEIETAYKEARQTERQLWNTIHRDAPVSTSPIRSVVNEITDEARKADSPANVPAFLKGLFAKAKTQTTATGVVDATGKPVTKTVTKLPPQAFGDMESVDEMMGLRSRILQEIRTESAKDAPNRVRIRNLERVNEAVIDSLSQRGDEASKAARQFSLELNNKFTRGPVGRVLGYTSQGGKRVPDETTLQGLFARGELGGVNADALQNAVQGKPEALDAISQFVRQKFVDATEDAGGKINANAAAKFLRDNNDFLKRFPALRADLQQAARGLRRAEDIVRINAPRSDLIRKQSRAALFLNVDDPVRVVGQVLQSKQPASGLKALTRMAAKDRSGAALDGLRAAVVESLFRRAQLRTLDNMGVEMLSAANMRKVLAENGAALSRSGLFKAQDMARLETVSKALDVAERSIASKIRGGSDTAQNVNTLTDMMTRVLGGRLGGLSGKHAGVSPLVMAQAGVRTVRRWLIDIPEKKVAEIVNQAIFDPELMQTLLMRRTEKTAPIIIRRLRGSLYNVAPYLPQPPEERNQKPQQSTPNPGELYPG